MKQVAVFIKKYRFDIIVSCGVIAFIYDLFANSGNFYLTAIFLYMLAYAADSEKIRNNIAERKRFIPKGLVDEDIQNIKFVKNWDEIRKRGMVKYSLIDGGVFFGFVLCAVISILTLLIAKGTLTYIMEDPGNMFNFILYTYVAGATMGIVSYRFLWLYKEKRFIRLTDPLH